MTPTHRPAAIAASQSSMSRVCSSEGRVYEDLLPLIGVLREQNAVLAEQCAQLQRNERLAKTGRGSGRPGQPQLEELQLPLLP
ncbi:hypothetical protein [Streptomyces sp.]